MEMFGAGFLENLPSEGVQNLSGRHISLWLSVGLGRALGLAFRDLVIFNEYIFIVAGSWNQGSDFTKLMINLFNRPGCSTNRLLIE